MLNDLRDDKKVRQSTEIFDPKDALPLVIFGVEQSLRRVQAHTGCKTVLEPWPELAHAERIVQHQLAQLPECWARDRQNLADRLCRLLLLRFAHTRIFADTTALAQCPAILLALSRVWRGESITAQEQGVHTLAIG